jgi:hypothetical protein
MSIYRKREDFKNGAEADVELLVPAGDLPMGIYKLKDVPDCAIIAGYVREAETEEDIKTSPVNTNTPPVLFSEPTAPPPEVLPKGELPPTEKGEKK